MIEVIYWGWDRGWDCWIYLNTGSTHSTVERVVATFFLLTNINDHKNDHNNDKNDHNNNNINDHNNDYNHENNDLGRALPPTPPPSFGQSPKDEQLFFRESFPNLASRKSTAKNVDVINSYSSIVGFVW